MELGHVLTPTLGISKLTWQNSHWKQNIFLWLVLTGFETFLTCFDRFWYFFDMFWHFFDMFWHFFDTFWHFFDRQTNRWTDGQTDLSYMTCFDTFLTCFDTFLTVFDIFDIFLTDRQTDRHTEPRCRSSGSELKNRHNSINCRPLAPFFFSILW